MREFRIVFAALVVLTVGLLAAAAQAAAPIKITDPKDQQIVDLFLAQVEKVPQELSAERCKALADEDSEGTEAYHWRVMPYLRMPLTAYQMTGKTRYLDMFVQCFENMRAALTKGPDGYLGWYGKLDPQDRGPNDDPNFRMDAIPSSFSASGTACDFIDLVDKDPALKQKYAKQRAEYLDLAANQLLKKHDARGDYIDLGNYAIYRRDGHTYQQTTATGLTLPHNKHAALLEDLLSLYRVTGNDEYMRRAVKLAARFKRSLTLKDGHYEWNYWDPAGEWDVSPSKPDQWKHWIGPEHRGGYYSITTSQAVSMYQYGLVFDGTDMDRFVRTQLDMCWNGDFNNPVWSRVDGTRPEKYTQGEYMADALAPLNDTIARLIFTGKQQDERLNAGDDSWSAGAVANGWIRDKFIIYPAARGEKQIYLDYGKRFLSKKENREFMKSVGFGVTGSGYTAPQVPSEMKPMVRVPKQK